MMDSKQLCRVARSSIATTIADHCLQSHLLPADQQICDRVQYSLVGARARLPEHQPASTLLNVFLHCREASRE